MDFTAISLFSGAGGMDVGFKEAGFSVLVANELDPHASDTYRENHPESKLIEADINSCMNEFSSYKGVDVVFGGPPCQGFSVAGKMDPGDPRSKLVFSFVDVIDLVQPGAFVMENVKALGSLSKFSIVRNELMRRFNSLGYTVSVHILNSRDFGVPQSRERVFFVGTREGYEPVAKNDFSAYEKVPLTLREAIAHLGPAGSITNPRVCNAKVTLAAKPVMRKSPYAGMLFNGQGRPLNPDGWSSTLPASMGGNRTPVIDEAHLYKGKQSWVEKYHSHLSNGGEPYGIYDAPARLRRLTIDEAAILQSFPKSYKFNGPQSKVFSQIGNAVPCDLAKVVACVVKDSLDGKKRRAEAKLLRIKEEFGIEFILEVVEGTVE